MKTAKVFSPSIRHFRTIPRHAPFSHNRRMEQNTADEMERAEEIDDLLSLIRNLNLQLTWAREQNQQLRVKLNRYEATMGWEEAA
jgi:hypothetical protein